MENYFSKNFAYLRKLKSMTFIELEAELGIKKSTLQAYEVGGSEPTLSKIRTIIRYFGVTFSDITDKDMETGMQVNEPSVVYGRENVNQLKERIRDLESQNKALLVAIREFGAGRKEFNSNVG